MKMNIKYFGIIAEKYQLTEETINVNPAKDMNLRLFFEKRIPFLSQMKYSIAINHELKDCIDGNSDEIEVALLPPFAGG